MTRLLPAPLLLVVALSLGVLAIVLYRTPQTLAPLYYGSMCALGVLVYHGNRGVRFTARLQALPGPVLLRAVFLGYAAVVFEETLVGTSYALTEGFTPAIWVARVGQFIAFNLSAFTGAILGLALAILWLRGLSRWHLLIAGGWGIFAERAFIIFLKNPIAGALIAGPNVAAYSIILAPLVLSIPCNDAVGRGRAWWAPLVAWMLMLFLSLPAAAFLIWLRGICPDAFPNCDYIPCD